MSDIEKNTVSETLVMSNGTRAAHVIIDVAGIGLVVTINYTQRRNK